MNPLKNKALLREANYIDGTWSPADTAKTLPVYNPFDQSIIGHIPLSQSTEANRAIDAASKALPAWKKQTMKERSVKLHAWADLIEENLEDLAVLMTLEHGKPLKESKAELNFGLNLIRWFAEEGRRSHGEIVHSNNPNQRILVTKEAIGVVGFITPWNFPMATPVRKIAAALAVGCTVVIKPAELAPFSALAIGYLAEQASIPKGVLNMVTGDAQQIGKALTEHPKVRAFSFTGSTRVGKILQQQCTETLKKTGLELGGNSPLIVFDDADIDLAVKGTMASKFRNMGQTCVCTNRIYVHRSVYKAFLDRLKTEVNQLRLGNGLDDQVDLGPLIDKKAIEKIQRLVKDAIDKGATLIAGGKMNALCQNILEPTILVDATEKMDVYQEEIFGPVAVIYVFDDEDEVIKKANDTVYGLAAYLFTNDLRRAIRVSEAIESGIVSVNEGVFTSEVIPFGGFKQSGIGREGGHEGLSEFLETKSVCIGDIK